MAIFYVLVPVLSTQELSLVLFLNLIVDTHDKVTESNLLGAQLLLNTSHRLNEPLVLLVLLLPLIHIIIVLVEFDKLFLKARLNDVSLSFFAIRQVFTVEIDDFVQLWTVLTLTRLQHNPHHYVFE